MSAVSMNSNSPRLNAASIAHQLQTNRTGLNPGALVSPVRPSSASQLSAGVSAIRPAGASHAVRPLTLTLLQQQGKIQSHDVTVSQTTPLTPGKRLGG